VLLGDGGAAIALVGRLLAKSKEGVRVAAIQFPSVLGDVEGNRARLLALVEEAAKGGAKIVVLPEAAITGYLSQDLRTTWHVAGRPRSEAFPEGRDPKDSAETVPGPSTERFAEAAKRLGIYVTVPIVEVARDGPAPRYYNTVCLVSPRGEIVAHYRKITPWPHPEQSWATDGDRGLVTYETEYGKVGLAICFDVHAVWPRYAKEGLWALLYPIAWVSNGDDEDWFGRVLPARAKEMGFHVIGANWSVDAPQPWHGYGHSVVLSRDGSVLARAPSDVGPSIVYATLSE
jgi:predicted amidohydrolase